MGFKPTIIVDALVVHNGVVVYTGSLAKAQAVARSLAEASGCRVQQLEFRGTIVPGFIDAHMHVFGTGLDEHAIDLRECYSIDELKGKLRRESGRYSKWVYGRGWDQEKLGRWPTRDDLDEVVPDKPALLVRVCGHVAVANSKALEVLGIDSEDGLLFEDDAARAVRMVKESVDPVKPILAGMWAAARNGITTVADMGADARSLAGYVKAQSLGLVPVRARVYLSRDLFDNLVKLGFVPALGDELIRIVGVKLFADGSLGARTAYLREPYSDDSSTRGKKLLTSDGVEAVSRRAAEWGLDVAVHAIGDAALEEVLKGFAKAGVRGRVEHASLAPPDLLDLMARIGVRVAVQPRFLVSDYWIVERLGEERARWAYPYRSMLSRGVTIGFSSDSPVEPLSPLEGVQAVVTRGVLGELTRDEALSVEVALHLYTSGSAAVLGEDRLGCLSEGCFADMTVLSQDPLEAGIDGLRKIEVLATIVGGEVVYDKSRERQVM
ncbi:MAG: amidohydrolase [Thermoproteota archaeon]